MKIVKKIRAGEKPRLPAWIVAEIRPVLTFTGAGSALWAGSAVLARRGWDALGEHLGQWERLGAIAVGGYVAVYVSAQSPRAAVFASCGAAVAWCVAAWWVAPPAVRPKPPAQGAEEDIPELALTEFALLVRRVARHRHAAHLADLLAEPELAGWTQAELKATATVDFGLPVEEVKLILDGRQRVRDGIRVRDLPPEPPPSAAVEALPRPDPAPVTGPE